MKDWVNASGSAETSQTLTITTESDSEAKDPSEIPEYSLFPSNTIYNGVLVFQATRVHKLVEHWGQKGYLPDATTNLRIYPSDYPNLMWRGTAMNKKDDNWGKTRQSKVDSLSHPRAAWWPHAPDGWFPPDGSMGVYSSQGSMTS